MHTNTSISSFSKAKIAIFSLLFKLLILSFIFLASYSCTPTGLCRERSNTQLTLAAYYPNYSSDLLPVEDIPWEDYTHLDYFVIESPSTPKAELEIGDEKKLIEFIKAGKSHNVTVSLTIGGWTGSVYFSSLVASSSSRKAFARNIAKTLEKYGFDGIDLDWEYPNAPGQDKNQISKDDSENFLKFLQVLRTEVGPQSRISAAVPVHGFVGSDGEYLKDHRPYAKVLDFITIMAYDLAGPSRTPIVVPNAPLFDTCNDPEVKFSASQIILGIPSYGYQYQLEDSKLNVTHFSSKAGQTSLFFGSIDQTKQGKGSDPDQESPERCGSPYEGGKFLFKDLMTCGLLSSDGETGLNGFQRHYDNCTHTPLLFNPTSKLLIAYDDQESLAEKTKFAKSQGLAGINIFDADGDSQSKLLLKSIKKALYS
ncbi:family 18 glycoside hydrolase [Melampsora americana]|nr:family 18 glycoside hydrolase [Melampsora americana]